MTYQQKVTKLMDAKREMFEDWRYFTLEDRLNVYRMSEELCKDFWETVIYAMAKGHVGSAQSCIYCYKSKHYLHSACMLCSYGESHGICNEYGSLWDRIGDKYSFDTIRQIIYDIEGPE